jgi:hypothetical protein
MKNAGKIWSEEHVQYLVNNYADKSLKEMREYLGRKDECIRVKAHSLGLKKNGRDLYPGEKLLKHLKETGIVINGEYKGCEEKVEFICPYCGSNFEYFPKVLMSKKKYSCGCVSFGKRLGGEYVSGSYIGQLRRGATSRNMEFNLSSKFLDDLLKKQNFKCALSGLDLTFGYIPTALYTASIDRKNSDIPYIESNVWWVHRDINICKQSFSIERFIEICKTVARNNGLS